MGSDQVWRDKYILNNSEYYYLGFVDSRKTRKISYAASFGTDKWLSTELSIQDAKRLLSDFDHISVREKSGVEICKKTFQMNATVHFDPTLLLNASDYVRLFNLKTEPSDYLFAYVLDKTNEIEKEIKQMALKMGLSVKIIGAIDENINTLPPISTWLEYIKNATVVVTDSFHGTVFSILFSKQFWVLGNKDRGLSRFTSLLGELDLTDRLITEQDYRLTDLNDHKIDYEKVHHIIDIKRQEAGEYLNQYVNKK